MNYYPPPQTPYSSHYQLESDDYELVVRQQPREALLTQEGKEKNRKPVDPPPVIEVNVRPNADPSRQYLQSPYLFMCCSLVPSTSPVPSTATPSTGLCGQVVSSLHRLKDIDNKDGGFFVFGDLSVKKQGVHHLRFSLFELRKDTGGVVFLKSITTDLFHVVQSKDWSGLDESTHLSRTFAEQGVRLRLRKEPRALTAAAQNLKRSYPFTSQATVQAGPSRSQQRPQAVPGYESGAQYETHGQQPPLKRHRSDETSTSQQMDFSRSTRSEVSYDPRTGDASPAVGYSMQAPMARYPPAQFQYPTQSLVLGNEWPQHYGQGSAPAPARSMDFSFRSTPILDASGAAFQGAGMAQAPYSARGQSSSGPVSVSSAGPPMHPHSAPTFQMQTPSYGNLADPTQYPYPPNPQYRSEHTYSALPATEPLGRQAPPSGGLMSHSVTPTLQQMPHQSLQQDPGEFYQSENPESHQYGEPESGFVGQHYSTHERTTYPPPPTSRSWS